MASPPTRTRPNRHESMGEGIVDDEMIEIGTLNLQVLWKSND